MLGSPSRTMKAPPDSASDVETTQGTSTGDAPDEHFFCEHADRCGGCPILGLPYTEQLLLKRGRVLRAVSRYPALELVVTEAVVPAKTRTHYRSRAKLIVAPGARVGLFAKGGGHNVVDIPGCQVLSPPLARIVDHVRRLVAASEGTGSAFAAFDPVSGGFLRALDLRETRNDGAVGVLVTLVVEQDRVADLVPLTQVAQELMKEFPEVVGVAANFHAGDTPQVLGTRTVPLSGSTSAPDRIGESVQSATFGSFVQVHRGQAERVHRVLADAVALVRTGGRAPQVLNLYGGSGAIALGLAAGGAEVHLVESFAPSVAQAREAARAQSLPVHAQCADVATALGALGDEGRRFDVAVVNPPRRGMSPSAREGLARLGPELIAYVSCDPDTLGRDLDHFARLGYAATSLRPLDMIPLTEEVETIALLRRAGSPVPRVIYEDDEVVIVDKSPHEPTAPQGEYATSLVARARRLRNARQVVPVDRLDVGTSGLVVLVRSPEYVGAWGRVLSSPTTRKIYVAAVRGITPGKGTVTRDLREHGQQHAARTRYRRLAIAGGQSVLRVVPDQSRTHQVRRHLASIGHPVLGDDRYGHAQTNRHFEEKNGLDRTFLHCVRLELDHPHSGARVVVESPLAGDLRAVLERIVGLGTLRFLDQKNALGPSGTSTIPPSPPEAPNDTDGPLDVDAALPTIRPEPPDDGGSALDDD